MIGTDETAGIAQSPRAARWEWPEPAAGEAMAPLRAQMGRAYQLPTAAGRVLRADPRQDLDCIGETRTPTTTWESTQVLAYSASGMDHREENPRMADCPEVPQVEDHQEDRQEDDQEDPRAADHQAQDHLEDH